MGKVNIQKRGKVYQYQFEIAPQDGKRKWITKSGFKTKPEAEREGLKALNEYLETGHSFKPSEISYSDYLDYWMEEYCYINLKHRTERGFAKSYMKSILKVIKYSFDYAAEIVNFIKYDPSIKVKVPKYDEPDGDPVHIFTKEEIDLIFNSVKNNHCVYYAFLTAYCTGLRIAEVFALTWEDIDFYNKTIS